jgi:hypothetical protein
MAFPNGTDLGYGTITAGYSLISSQASVFVTAVFTSAVSLTSGIEYAIVVKNDTKVWPYYIKLMCLGTGTYSDGEGILTYAGNSAWESSAPNDVPFQLSNNSTVVLEYSPSITAINSYIEFLYGSVWGGQTFTPPTSMDIDGVALPYTKGSSFSFGDIKVSIQKTGTAITAPGQATTPFPTNAGVSVSLNVSSLTWVDGGNTDYFKVYVGDTSGSLTWIASTITTLTLADYLAIISYPFDYKETLYWRVDAVNTEATTSGVEWSFTTLKLTPPSPTGYYTVTKQFYRLLPVTSTTSGWGSAPGIGVENYDYAFLTSTYFYNVINTNKKLIAAANSAIWYET